MTGDGVNDAPALKKVDIGIAVADATDSASGASDIVLTEPGLSVILIAVLTSRAIFQRMKNYTINALFITIRIVFGFMFIALIWKFDFSPFMVLIIAILNDGTIKSRDHTKFETFDLALDEFYNKIESQRSEQQHKAKENSALQKLNKKRNDQENRVHTLRKEADNCIKMAELIEYNLDDVDAAILVVPVSLAKGMSWDDLTRMVKEEKKVGNPVAGLMYKLHLERNCMTLLLSNNLDEMDDNEKTLPADKDPKRIADIFNSTENEESCTTYNMLKVSRHLFRWTKEVTYADCLNEWCTQYTKRNRSWGDDLYASFRYWGFQS